MELALVAGAEDVTDEGEVYQILTTPAAYQKVKAALVEASIPIEASTLTHLPTTTVAVEGETAQKILKLIDALDDNDDVQTVSHNAEIPDSVTI
jgi:transcriptional/translational regulatory protein YebC/TACO1